MTFLAGFLFGFGFALVLFAGALIAGPR